MKQQVEALKAPPLRSSSPEFFSVLSAPLNSVFLSVFINFYAQN